MNLSPWIQQLNRMRPVLKLEEDAHTEVAIVGGGISGIATAYFTLKRTAKNVLLIEGDKVAHGATGHNGGQLVSYFERPFHDIVREFGLPLAAKAQDEVLSAWELLEEIFREAKLQTPITQFTGYAGCKSLEQLLPHLENKWWRSQASIKFDSLYIAKEADFLRKIPEKYENLYAVVSQQEILDLLETNNEEYFVALSSRKGCMNSALFCEELAGYMLKTYPDRFTLIEHTPVKKVVLNKNNGILLTDSHKITANKIVLCTNGFENIEIENTLGSDIDTKFHELVSGVVGYMAGYLAPLNKPPTAITYFVGNSHSKVNISEEQPYVYLTRRVYGTDKHEQHNLICIGGPESHLDEKIKYTKTSSYPASVDEEIENFLHKNYKDAPKVIDYKFKWHGLMGYTKNGIRCIGPEPCNPVLLYNLGCNGVGLLPAIYGGKRIALFIKYGNLPKSIFDPADQRCTPNL